MPYRHDDCYDNSVEQSDVPTAVRAIAFDDRHVLFGHMASLSIDYSYGRYTDNMPHSLQVGEIAIPGSTAEMTHSLARVVQCASIDDICIEVSTADGKRTLVKMSENIFFLSLGGYVPGGLSVNAPLFHNNHPGTFRITAKYVAVRDNSSAKWNVVAGTGYQGKGAYFAAINSATQQHELVSVCLPGFTAAGFDTAEEANAYAAGLSVDIFLPAGAIWGFYNDWPAYDNQGSVVYCVDQISVDDTGTVEISYDGNGHTGGQIPTPHRKGAHDVMVKNRGRGWGNGYWSDPAVPRNCYGITRPEHNYHNWNTAANGSGTDYNLNTGNQSYYGGSTDLVLYAKWARGYTVTYDGNAQDSGTAPTSQTKIQGVSLTLSGNTGSLAKSGYMLSGWNTAADGSGTHYALGGTYTTDASVTLYAEWTAAQWYCQWYRGGMSDGYDCPDGPSEWWDEEKTCVSLSSPPEDTCDSFEIMYGYWYTEITTYSGPYDSESECTGACT
jgi:hypothetical protein